MVYVPTKAVRNGATNLLASIIADNRKFVQSAE